MTLPKARITGAVYLLYFVTVIFAAGSVGRVPATFSVAANLIANAGYIAVTVLLYQMLKPVNRNLALLAVAISLLGCVVQSLGLFQFSGSITSPSVTSFSGRRSSRPHAAS